LTKGLILDKIRLSAWVRHAISGGILPGSRLFQYDLAGGVILLKAK